ncbi:MAG: hypothetical protein M0R22_08865 [Dehalococcoidia bacterium]|jgi:hypothetical protein|nr:hypothetical protein [Dehalococcoidia bacterium]
MDVWPVTCALGLVVLWLGWTKLSGRLRLFVMMIGGSLVLFLLSVALHNGVSWLAGETLGIEGFEEPVFFLLAVIMCPLALLVGVVGALVTWLKGRPDPR